MKRVSIDIEYCGVPLTCYGNIVDGEFDIDRVEVADSLTDIYYLVENSIPAITARAIAALEKQERNRAQDMSDFQADTEKS